MESTYLSIYSISERININTRKVISLIRSGKLRGYLFGSEYRVKEEDLNQFIARSEVMSQDLIGAVVNNAANYNAAVEGLMEIYTSQGMGKRDAESLACKVTVETRPQLLEDHQKTAEAKSMRRKMGLE